MNIRYPLYEGVYRILTTEESNANGWEYLSDGKLFN